MGKIGSIWRFLESGTVFCYAFRSFEVGSSLLLIALDCFSAVITYRPSFLELYTLSRTSASKSTEAQSDQSGRPVGAK